MNATSPGATVVVVRRISSAGKIIASELVPLHTVSVTPAIGESFKGGAYSAVTAATE
jgi:hypothetical protein